MQAANIDHQLKASEAKKGTYFEFEFQICPVARLFTFEIDFSAKFHGERAQQDPFAVGVRHGDEVILAPRQQGQTSRALQQRRQRIA